MWAELQEFPLHTAVGRAALVGAVLAVLGYGGLLIKAFRYSIGWFLLLLLVPITVFRFSSHDWRERKLPLLTLSIGLLLMLPLMGDWFRAERHRRQEATKLGPEIFQDKAEMAEMELLEGGSKFGEAMVGRENFYEDLYNYVDEMSPQGPAIPGVTDKVTARSPTHLSAALHPDIPETLDTLEEQMEEANALTEQKKSLETRRIALKPGDTVGLATLREDITAFNVRTIRHRKAVQAFKSLIQGTPAPVPPATSGPVSVQR